ncbi:MAG: hypothetical protein LAP87_05815 [Acidobacteriia bacterium]|nr:hypothetical protein [Terriglobia bacterium]
MPGTRLAILLLLAAALASAGPISSCAANAAGGVTCNIFETDAQGNPAEVSSVFALGTSVFSGWVVLLENPLAFVNDVTQWSDVLHFIDDGSGLTASTAQLLSDGCNCFPGFDTVNAAPHVFLVETQTGTGSDFADFTAFQAPPNTYNIFSGAPVNENEVPEPAGAPLAAGGLLVVALAIGRRARPGGRARTRASAPHGESVQ